MRFLSEHYRQSGLDALVGRVRLSALYHGSGTESCGTGTTHEIVEWMLSGFGH